MNVNFAGTLPVAAMAVVAILFAGSVLFVTVQSANSLTPDERRQVDQRRSAYQAWLEKLDENLERQFTLNEEFFAEKDLLDAIGDSIQKLFSCETKQALARAEEEERELTPDETARLASDVKVVEELMGISMDEFISATVVRFLGRAEELIDNPPHP